MKKLIKLLLIAGIILALVKLVQHKKEAWVGLTETEVRDKLESKLSARVPSEKLTNIQDKVVAKMSDHGKLADEPEDSEPEESGPEQEDTAADAV